MHSVTCAHCAAPYESGRSDSKYCSQICKRRAAWARAKQSGAYRAALESGRRERAANRYKDMRCHVCGETMRRIHSAAKYCSKACALVAPIRLCSVPGCQKPHRARGYCRTCYRKANPEKWEWTDRRRDNYHRRRARKNAASTGRPVLLEEIRERDGNRCHLCSKKVPDRAYPHPLSPSLDHVIPLSKGGAHDPDNVRLAHLRCNVEKGSGGGNEQLLLIG